MEKPAKPAKLLQPKKIFFNVVETINEEGHREVVSPPDIWFKDGLLYWPPKFAGTKRKNLVPIEDDWQPYKYKMLKSSIGSLRQALAEEKRYANFSNTESEKEDEKRRLLNRLHPVGIKNPIDANGLFDKVKTDIPKKDVKPGISEKVEIIDQIIFDPVLPPDLFEGNNDDPLTSALIAITGDSMVSNNVAESASDFNSTMVSGQSTADYMVSNDSSNSTTNDSNISTLSAQDRSQYQPCNGNDLITIDSRSTMVSNQCLQGQQYDYGPYKVNKEQTQVGVPTNNMYGQPNQMYEQPNQMYEQVNQIYGQQNQIYGQTNQMYRQNYSQPNQFYNYSNQWHCQPNQFYGQQNWNCLPPFTKRDVVGGRDISPPTTYISSTWSADVTAGGSVSNIPVNNYKNSKNIGFSAKSPKSGPKKEATNYKNDKSSNCERLCKLKKANEKKQPKTIRTKAFGEKNFCKSRKGESTRSQGSMKSTLNLKAVKTKCKKQTNKPSAFQSDNNIKKVGNSPSQVKTMKDTGVDVHSESDLVGYINNFIPSPIHNEKNDPNDIDYLRLIHKETVEIKKMIQDEAMKRNEKYKKLEQLQTEILEKLNYKEETTLTEEDVERIDAILSIKEDDKLRDFEFKLYTDPIYSTKVKLRCARIGGPKPHLMLRRIYKKLVIDEVLERYTWTGTKTKGAFQNFTYINKVVQQSIRMIYPMYTESEYETYMVDFLRHSKSRQRPQSKKNMENTECQYEQNESENEAEMNGYEDDDGMNDSLSGDDDEEDEMEDQDGDVEDGEEDEEDEDGDEDEDE